MRTMRVIVAVLLVGLCVYTVGMSNPAPKQVFTGWATFVGAEVELPFATAKKGYHFVRIELQIQNVSKENALLVLSYTQLRDGDGYVYPCHTVWFPKLARNYDLLVHGEVLWCLLTFEIPINAVPDMVIINPWAAESFPSQHIHIAPSPPSNFLRQKFSYLLPGGVVSLSGLQWSIDSIALNKDGGELTLTLSEKNQTSSIIDLGLDYGLDLPSLRDIFGHVAGLTNKNFLNSIPRDIRPGEVFKVRCLFNVKGLEPPLYFLIEHGVLFGEQRETAVWRVLPNQG